MPNKTPSVFLAGAAIGAAAAILNLIPLLGGCLSCIAFITAGLLAVWHYTDRHQLTLDSGQGASLGALAGIVAMIAWGLLQALFMALGITQPLEDIMTRSLEDWDLDPSQREQVMDLISSPLLIIALVLVFLVIYALLGAIGGAIGASVFKKGPAVSPDIGGPGDWPEHPEEGHRPPPEM